MFNLNSLNVERLEVMGGATWGRGQIPESPDSFIDSLVRRVDRGRFRFEIRSLSNGPQLGRSQDMSSEMAHEGIGISMLAMGQATTTPSPT